MAGDTPVLVHNCGVTLLGKWRGEYEADPNALRNFADKAEYNVLSTPNSGWGRWRWNRNLDFIDEAIERGDEIRLMHNPDRYRFFGGVYKKELKYLRNSAMPGKRSLATV